MPVQYSRTVRWLSASVGCAAVVFSQHIWASGFGIAESSITGLGMSNAMVANPDEAGAFSYNAAAMGFHEQSSLTAGIMALFPNLEADTDSGSHDSKGKDTVGVPLIQGALKIGTDWTLGLGVSAPFGLETKWKQGTFPAFGTLLAPAAPTHTKLDLLAITPTLTYRVADHLSIAAGADFYNAFTVKLNSAGAQVEGDGTKTGWNLAAMFRQGDWSAGVSYHSDVTINVHGHFRPAGSGSLPAQANLDLPWRLQAGARWKATDKLAVEFDITRTGWSEFDRIKIKTDGNSSFVPRGTVLSINTNDWKDANAYRVGASYQITPSTQLRFGYSYDKTPQKDAHFSARIPDNDRHLFSIGAGHDLGDGWGIEAGYMYVHFENRNYSSNTPFTPPRQDANGTAAYDGKYKSHVHLFGLGIRKAFM